MKLPAIITYSVSLAALLVSANAQQTVFDVEPNQTKALATPAIDLVDGDVLFANGFGQCGSGPPDVDYFRARTLAMPPGIYRHDLVDLGSSATEMRLVGLDAIQDIVIPGSYDYLQTEALDGTGNGFISWYGFGKSEEVYIDLFASYSCRSVAMTALMTTSVTPTDLGVISSPTQPHTSISLRTSGAVTPLDTELQVFDSEFNAIPQLGVDEIGTIPAVVSGFLEDGVYYVAVSDHNLATHLPHRVVDGESRTLAGALDYAGGAACGSDASGIDLMLELSSPAVGTISTVVTKMTPYEISWFRFEVGTGQHSEVFCTGDGVLASCPNGNQSPLNAGAGCLNSSGRGATLLRYNQVVFTLEDLPPLATALLFVGPQVTAAPAPTGDGLVCIGPGASRAGPISANLSGTAATNHWTPGLTTGLGMAGTTVYVQAAYRDATIAGFNFTNALAVQL